MPHFSEMKSDKNLSLSEGDILIPPLNMATFMSPQDRKTIDDSKVQNK
jgi:hypothetical protein